jgi:hypothetical protein
MGQLRHKSGMPEIAAPILNEQTGGYNRVRQSIGETIVKHSRKLGTYMGVNLQTEEDRAMHALLQDPRAMLDWIAVPNFLNAYR